MTKLQRSLPCLSVCSLYVSLSDSSVFLYCFKIHVQASVTRLVKPVPDPASPTDPLLALLFPLSLLSAATPQFVAASFLGFLSSWPFLPLLLRNHRETRREPAPPSCLQAHRPLKWTHSGWHRSPSPHPHPRPHPGPGAAAAVSVFLCVSCCVWQTLTGRLLRCPHCRGSFAAALAELLLRGSCQAAGLVYS